MASAYTVPEGAQKKAAFDGDQARATLTLLSEFDVVEKDQPFKVGVSIKLAPEWHVYWTNAGGGAMATELSITADNKILPVVWPAPHRIPTAGGSFDTFGYEEEVIIEASLVGTGEDIQLKATVDFLVCKVDCIPDRIELARTISVGSKPAHADLVKRFATFRSQHPTPVKHHFVDPTTLVVELESEPHSVVFFPNETGEGPDVTATQWEQSRLRISFESSPGSGVLVTKNSKSRTAFLITSTTSTVKQSETESDEPKKDASALWLQLIFALLGGLLLNLMPCVLPVLMLKVSMLSSGEERNHKRDALSFVLGCIGAMGLLGGIVLLLRNLGVAVGWGFQLQQPGFLIVLMAVLLVFALNLFGVFEIGVSANRLIQRVDGESGWLRPALEGVLTVVLATPCSAPLVGSAVGFAMLGSSLSLMLILMTMGLGLAIPTAALLLVPQLQRLLPKPGPWQNTLQKLLGFSLLAVSAWLLFVFGGVQGMQAQLLALFGLVAIAAACSLRVRWLQCVGAAMGIALAVFACKPPAIAHDWAPFTPEAVEKQVSAGEVVFVDYTADWCVTCKVNEAQVLESDVVQDAFKEAKAKKFIADWTKRDEVIRASLAKYNRAAVPMYLVYGPAVVEPLRLPELLTKDIVIEALARVSTKK